MKPWQGTIGLVIAATSIGSIPGCRSYSPAATQETKPSDVSAPQSPAEVKPEVKHPAEAKIFRPTTVPVQESGYHLSQFNLDADTTLKQIDQSVGKPSRVVGVNPTWYIYNLDGQDKLVLAFEGEAGKLSEAYHVSMAGDRDKLFPH